MNILKKYAYVYIITIITSYTIIFLENKFLPRIDVNNKQIRYLNVHQSDMVRFIGPIILFMYLDPIIAFIICSVLLDNLDPIRHTVYTISYGEVIVYNKRDKLFDFWQYLVAFIFLLIKRPKYLVKFIPLLSILLLLRLIGNLMFFKTHSKKYFFYFPNFYEVIYIFGGIMNQIKNMSSFIRNTILVVLCMFKLLHEYFHHYNESVGEATFKNYLNLLTKIK